MLARSGTTRIAILTLLFCLASSLPIHARGRAERDSRLRLEEVERLIEEKRYNEAILRLSEIVKEDPDRFDAAERLMMRIRVVREQYNAKFDELIEVLFEQNDLGRALELIAELEALDPNPSEAVAKALARARSGTEVVYFLSRFSEIMQRAKVEIGAGRYEAAIGVYLEGFTINKESFDQAGYGNIVKDTVNAALSVLNRSLDEFTGLSAAGDRAAAALVEASSRADALAQSTAELRSIFARTMALKAAVDQAGTTFRMQNRQIRAGTPEDRYDLFLYFAEQLVFGPGAAAGEGISNSMEAIWRRSLDSLRTRLGASGESTFTAAIQEYRGAAFKPAAERMRRVQEVFKALMELDTLWPLPVAPGSLFPLDRYGLEAADGALAAFLRSQEYLQAAQSYLALTDNLTALIALEGSRSLTLEQINLDRGQVAALSDRTARLKTQWESQLVDYRQADALGYSVEPHIALGRSVIQDIEAVVRRAASLEIRYLDRIAGVRGVEYENLFQRYKESFDEGVRLQEGIEVAQEPTRDENGRIIETPVRLEKYPTRAQALFRALTDNLVSLRAATQSLLEETLRNKDYVDQSEELKIHVASLSGLIERIDAMQSDLIGRLEAARAASLQAERYKQEGSLRFSEARSNVNNRRYADARLNVQRAQEAFDASLGFQEDAQVRRLRDVELVALSRRIVELENSVVIDEVRQLIEAGRRLYTQGDFTGAEQTLIKAQARWADTNPEENEEVNFWLELVRNAVKASTGREIALTDPLYKEMSQLHNLALGDFQDGRKLIEQGRRVEALGLLRRAEERIAKILIAFPYNAQARVLSLQILQLSDPGAYGRRITQLYNEALTRRSESPQEAYAILKDIEQIQPRYPGLREAIAALEINLGMRIPAPDPAKIAQSRDLYLQARSTKDRNIRDLFPVAIKQLNEAIRLNPDNRDAVVLKDQIQRDIGGTRENVLSSDDQRLLREAEGKYLQGRYFEALVIIERLLKNPKNRNNPDVVDLEKKVRAKTG